MSIDKVLTKNISKDGFWQMADELQEQTVSHSNDLFTFVESAEPRQLLSILVQYRFFTIYYIPDLAILVARLEDGKLRSFLADILSDELGYGDPKKAHPYLYDQFLKSIGVSDKELDNVALNDNIILLENVRRNLMNPDKSTSHGIGLRGMGGECVCQIYLSRLYYHIIKNPYIKDKKDQIDWYFWELHVGEHDVEHRIKTRELINNEIVEAGGKALLELSQGYYESMESWGLFWQNIFESIKNQAPARSQVERGARFRVAPEALSA